MTKTVMVSSIEVEIIRTAKLPDQEGCHPAEIVLGRKLKPICPSQPYCTWQHHTGTDHYYWGHYDMTLERAIEDFNERAKSD